MWFLSVCLGHKTFNVKLDKTNGISFGTSVSECWWEQKNFEIETVTVSSRWRDRWKWSALAGILEPVQLVLFLVSPVYFGSILYNIFVVSF